MKRPEEYLTDALRRLNWEGQPPLLLHAAAPLIVDAVRKDLIADVVKALEAAPGHTEDGGPDWYRLDYAHHVNEMFGGHA